MAKNDNIIDFLGDVADAIREKKGTAEPIAAQNFADEIKSIETDGMRYFGIRKIYWNSRRKKIPRRKIKSRWLLASFYEGCE